MYLYTHTNKHTHSYTYICIMHYYFYLFNVCVSEIPAQIKATSFKTLQTHMNNTRYIPVKDKTHTLRDSKTEKVGVLD